MIIRSKTTAVLLVAAAILAIALVSNQVHLAQNYRELQKELVIITRSAGPHASKEAESLPMDSEPEQSNNPNTRSEAYPALQSKLNRMEDKVQELQATIDQLNNTNASPVYRSFVPPQLPEQRITAREVELNGPRSWGHEQALGPPNTKTLGDIPTAWAPKAQDGGEEWLQVDFDKAVSLSEINIHETHNPGAISQVTAVMPNGHEKVIWEGEFESEPAKDIIERAFQIDDSITADSVKIYLDTTRVNGWNEIDAVELVGTDNSRQWASSVSASSSYAQ